MDKQRLDALTEFIFVRDEPAPADVICIPGNGHAEPAEKAAALFRAGFAPLLLPSGRWAVTKERFLGQTSGARAYPGDCRTEWEFMRAVLTENGVPEKAILREEKATFTWQNAIGSRAALEAAGIRVRRAILCCCRRSDARAWACWRPRSRRTRIRWSSGWPGKRADTALSGLA